MNFMLGQRAQSSIQVLVSVGLVGMLVMVMTTMFSNFARENAGLTEKLPILGRQQRRIRLLTYRSICSLQLSLPATTLDATQIGTATPPFLALNEILSATSAASTKIITVGRPVTPDAPALVVSRIEVTNITGS